MTKLTITFGEQRDGFEKSVRVWFDWVAPSGFVQPLMKCPIMEKFGSKFIRDDDNGRETTVIYHVKAPTTIRMIINKTVHGRKRDYKNIFIDIDEEAELIEINGADDFGRVVVRGSIDFDRSLTTKEFLETNNGYKVIGLSEKKKPRNIMGME